MPVSKEGAQPPKLSKFSKKVVISPNEIKNQG
jgi:hypothetical protein